MKPLLAAALVGVGLSTTAPMSAAAQTPASRATCQYDIKVLIDPQRTLLRGEATLVLRYLEESAGGSPLLLDPSFHVLETGAGESGLSRSPGLDPTVNVKWEGWPDLANRPGPTVSLVSQDYLLFGPELLFYPGATDELISSSGSFTVSAPERYQVVCDGVLVEETARQGFRKSVFRFGGLHGRPRMTALTLYPLVRDTTGKFEVRVVVSPANQSAIPGLVARVRAILEGYEAILGPYKYPSLTLLEAPRAFGSDFLLGNDVAGLGMKGLILLASDQLSGDLDESLLAHELAHQWWGSQIGMDPTPGSGGLWMIEGFAEYASLLWREKAGIQGVRSKQLAEWARQTRGIVDEAGDEALIRLRRDKSGKKALLAYSRAPFVLSMMEAYAGRERFHAALPALVRGWQGLRPTTELFEKDLTRITGLDWKPFFSDWVLRKGLPHLQVRYAVHRAADGGHRLVLEGSQKVPFYSMNVPVRIFESGQTIDRMLVMSGATGRLEIALSSDPTAVLVDPEGTLLYGSLTTTRVPPIELP